MLTSGFGGQLKFPSEELPGIAEEGSPEAIDGSNEDENKMDVETTKKSDEDEGSHKEEHEVEQGSSATTVAAGEQELRTLRTLLKYYKDGIRFIRQIEAVVPTMCELLASNAKGEVIEAMNFFVVAYKYRMECATVRWIQLFDRQKIFLYFLFYRSA